MDENESRAPRTGLPSATVERLAIYLGVLNTLEEQGVATISSGELAAAADVNPAQLRKDLSHLGSYGIRGVGYDVQSLRFHIDQNIGSAEDWPVVIVGVGNLGRALVNHSGFLSRGFRVVALFDADPAVIGRTVEGHRIHPLTELAAVVTDPQATIAVIATPVHAAQQVADQLVAAGVGCLLNFAATGLDLPPRVTVRRVDLGSELQILAYHRLRSLADTAMASNVTVSALGD
ncbi:redox-sensing transcriptional repressor Rex [Granulicoccus sp. GXG6511]|uniref:redox-sensing transcriptional repressor Rex n=1 Tax=Granulicoccus sp. GXG6511 TaxID=3381351 RepID=UPI003D7E7455